MQSRYLFRLVLCTLAGIAAASAGTPAHAHLVAAAKKPPAVLYADNFFGSDVAIFDESGRSQRPISQIGGIDPTLGLFVDSARNLYIAQSSGVLEYALGGSSPIQTFGDPGHIAGDVALCPNGTLYVSNEDNTVSVYAGGATEPTDTLTDNVFEIFAIACDANNDIFVSEFGKQYQVDEFPAGGSGFVNLPVTTGFPEGLAIDRAGDLVVANTSTVDFYHVGQNSPFKSIAVPSEPLRLSFEQGDKSLWVMTSAGTIQRYAVASGKLTDTISGMETGGIAASPAD
jgi:hypothetical protein